jgi:hypothetical protein
MGNFESSRKLYRKMIARGSEITTGASRMYYLHGVLYPFRNSPHHYISPYRVEYALMVYWESSAEIPLPGIPPKPRLIYRNAGLIIP